LRGLPTGSLCVWHDHRAGGLNMYIDVCGNLGRSMQVNDK